MIRHRYHRCYNYLNLPSEVIKDAVNKVMYIYDATGSKLCRRSTTGGTTTSRYYTGLMEYNGTTLDIIHNEEGLTYYTLVNGIPVYEYEYYLKDHLGNIRNTFMIRNNAAMSSQYTEYYPFGMVSASWSSGSSHNDYLYNGKELQRDLGMEWYDYGARFYDPQIGRFPSLDPIAEQFSSLSPYNYASNDPISCIDLWGLQGVRTNNILYPGIIKTANEYLSVKSQNPSWSNTRVIGAALINRAIDFVAYTDVNDATVISTTITRGSNAINIDGSQASTSDKVAAFVGLALPAISGSAVKKVFGAVGDALGISKKADNLGNPFKGKSLEQVQQGFEKQVEAGKVEVKYTDPVSGSTSYKNNESGYSYNVDTGVCGKTGEKVENAHVDVNYPNTKPTNVNPKRKFEIEEK